MNRFFTASLAALMLFSVSPATLAHEGDTDAPEMSEVWPLTAQYDVAQTFYATASDPSGVASCTLLVSSKYETPMTYNASQDRYEVSYTFVERRTANSIRVTCEDNEGNSANGPSKIIEVSEVPIDSPGDDTDVTPVPDEVDATGWTRAQVIEQSPVLIKTVCPGGEDVNHPCRAVYFLDNDGVRHAFPNAKAYFTWYERFENIHLVTDATMASYTLGLNVRYRPGVKLVKFRSLNTVYAVARRGLLLPLGSEEVARALYGENWNQQVDDVAETFYRNYTYGSTIEHSTDYDREAQLNSVASVNDNLGIQN